MTKTEKVLEVLGKENLDAVFMFSTKNDARYSSWLLGVEPLLYHYVCVLKTGEIKILEIDYLAESLGENVKDMIYPVGEENLFSEELRKFSREFNLAKVGLVGLSPYLHFQNSNLEIQNLNKEIDNLLAHKDESGIKKISEKAKKISEMLKSLSYEAFENKTELEASKYVKSLGEQWAAQESFPTSVVSGRRLEEVTAGLPTKNKIENGVVCLDCGFYSDGVHTDITRMYFKEGDEREEIYTKLVKIQNEIVAEFASGDTLGKISGSYKEKFKKIFGNVLFEEGDLGHSIGYGLHEDPIFIQEDNYDFIIPENFIFTLEPEIKVNGLRYRVEDMVLCKDGKLSILTK